MAFWRARPIGFGFLCFASSLVKIIQYAIKTIVCGPGAGCLARLGCATEGNFHKFGDAGQKAQTGKEAFARSTGGKGRRPPYLHRPSGTGPKNPWHRRRRANCNRNGNETISHGRGSRTAYKKIGLNGSAIDSMPSIAVIGLDRGH
jgi:hypothetical protein